MTTKLLSQVKSAKSLHSAKTSGSFQQGFTLIELLIVIAILGVLAGVVLVAINPIEQFARTRDAGRITAVGQLSRALQAYYTSHNGSYPVASATWITDLTNAGELKRAPLNPAYTAGGTVCATNVQGGFCYDTTGAAGGAMATAQEATAWTAMESRANRTKCGATAAVDTFYAWSSLDGRAGTVCTSVASTNTYVD